MTHFRKRFDVEVINELNESIVSAQREKNKKEADDHQPPTGDGQAPENPDTSSLSQIELPPNQGKLLIDATCAPSDITFPTDIGLLNKSREKIEKMIDILHEPLVGKQGKRVPTDFKRVKHIYR